MGSIKKILFFYLFILILLVLNSIIGKYLPPNIQIIVILFLISISSFSIIYFIFKQCKSHKKIPDIKKEEIVRNILKKLLKSIGH